MLARILERCTGEGFRVVALRVDQAPWAGPGDERRVTAGSAQVQLSIEGTGDVPALVTHLAEMSGVLGVWSPAEDADY